MSDASKREWRFYLDDMIDFAEKVLAYSSNFRTADRDYTVKSDPQTHIIIKTPVHIIGQN